MYCLFSSRIFIMVSGLKLKSIIHSSFLLIQWNVVGGFLAEERLTLLKV